MIPRMITLNQIRRTFLDYFAKHEHNEISSSPLVPHNDPTLMFTNAGMNQFKNIFTGVEKAPEPPKAASAQKCVRAGGKHNDLDNVGYTTRHHTFFEMLGNFSFGDYFKEGAIRHAWTLLTEEFNIPADKLYFTVYHTDDEAFALWKEITGCDDSRILRVPTNDNFWSMGDTGPCGPCSEIFYDHGEGLNGAWALDDTGHDLFDERYVEIWNLVFMQYEQVDKDTRIDLPSPCVDTGMGLERIATVLQGKKDNYDIDLFRHLIDAIKQLTHTTETTASHKVIADHLRSSCFLIADGVLPSNEGRGYVLRRIMRRGMRHAHMLGATEPLMHRLVPALIEQMGEHYEELVRAKATIITTLKQEETRFRQTLDRGLKLLEEAKADLKAGDALAGDVAFKLYDTYGFPLDLTEDILRGENMTVDQAGFDAAMGEQKARARAAWSGSGEAATAQVWFDIKEQHGATEFTGYSANESQGVVLALVKDGEVVDALKEGESGALIVNQTPFYGESGGQQGDHGRVTFDGGEALVSDTQKPVEGLHTHQISISKGSLKAGDTVTLSIDTERRARIKANHSATHLLHAALRKHLGEHVTQKGSLVAEDRLRFDITHPEQVTAEELRAVELEVNRLIWKNSAVSTQLMNKDDAIAAGAMAMFGEKYADEVRVLSMGIDEHSPHDYSVELCGGTHVHQTGDIGVFKIISESAVAAGVRRIEALTRDGAYAYLSEQDERIRNAAGLLVSRPEQVLESVSKLQEEKKQLDKQLKEAKKQLAMGGSGGGEIAAEDVGGIAFIGKSFGELPPKELRDIATQLSQQHKNAVIAVASASEGKASVIVAVGEQAANAPDAPSLVQIAVPVVGGKGGGGKPNFAQCGGSEGDKIDDAIAAIRSALEAKAA
jgi:alanyl-tRNA synthetase